MGIISRKGLGQVRHIDTNKLWIQNAASEGDIVLRRVKSGDNYADIMTKPLDHYTIERHMIGMGFEFA